MQRLIHFISHDNVVGFTANHGAILESRGSKNHLADGFECSITLKKLQVVNKE